MKRFLVLLLLIAGCSESTAFDACDIRKASCQEDIFLEVQRVRGSEWDPWLDMPPMRVITQAQYREELEADYNAAPTDPDVFDFWTPSYKLLALVDPLEPTGGALDFAATFFIAYYDPNDRSVTVIDHGDETDLRDATDTLAHELVHAAQDRDIGFELINAWPITSDGVYARSALIEGEARLYENLIDMEIVGVDPTTVRWSEYHAKWIGDLRDDIHADASPMRLASSGLRYALGSQYMTDAWLEGGPVGVRSVYDDSNRPNSAVQFMEGRGSALDVRRALPSCRPVEPGDGFARVGLTQFGAWIVYAFATRIFALERDAWRVAERWENDSFSVYTNDDKQVVVVWQIDLGSTAVANEFMDALVNLPATVQVDAARDGSIVTLFATTVTEPLDWPDWQTCDAE